MTIAETALAFARGNEARCHNAHTDGARYTLHKSVIAEKLYSGVIRFNWCGYHTRTTAAHMNAILSALGARHVRVSYAQARDNHETTFDVRIP